MNSPTMESPSAKPWYTVHGRVAVITLDNPPVNGLGSILHPIIRDGLQRAERDAGIGGILIIGSEKAFSAGADVRELNKPRPPGVPSLPEIGALQDQCPKPIVAAIGGFALGGGLELALACHYRIALADSRLGLTEVKLGLLPGAGGTQRLPRLIGAAKALEMMTGGEPIRAQAALECGLIDRLVHEKLLDSALQYTEELVAQSLPPRRVRDMKVAVPGDASSFFAGVKRDLEQSARGFPAPFAIVACVEAAASLPFDEGCKVERRRFEELLNGPETRAMRHIFFAERQAAKVDDVPESTPARKIAAVSVAGKGPLACAIALTFAEAGIPVSVLGASTEELERGVEALGAKSPAGSNDPSQGRRHKTTAPITCAATDSVLSADIVVEASGAAGDTVRQVLQELGRVVRPGAIIATTSPLVDVDTAGALTGRPQDVIGMFLSWPPGGSRAMEIVRGAGTAPDALATAIKLARTLKKLAVVSRAGRDFVGPRLMKRYLGEVAALVDRGMAGSALARALYQWGMALDPAALGRALAAPEPSARVFPGSTPGPDAADEAGDEVVQRCIGAMVDEATAMLKEGIVQRPSDIDVLCVAGYGFPAYRGGPMFWAEQRKTAAPAAT